MWGSEESLYPDHTLSIAMYEHRQATWGHIPHQSWPPLTPTSIQQPPPTKCSVSISLKFHTQGSSVQQITQSIISELSSVVTRQYQVLVVSE